DTADFGGGQKDIVGFLAGKESVDGDLVQKFQLLVGAGENVAIAQAHEIAMDRRADQPLMAGNVDAAVGFHEALLLRAVRNGVGWHRSGLADIVDRKSTRLN